MPIAANSSLTLTHLQDGIRAGKVGILAKAITLAESTREADRQKIEQLLRQLLPHTGKSIRIGITGVPGVGKSTFIEVFGELLTTEGKKVAVLAIDPTSQKTKGSILGDKTRMERLSRNPHVFIRPSPTSLALGGVSFHTRESILLCEAAGYDVILIETVGVGQSETNVRSMVDFFLLLMLAGAGDELQGIKKGIMEMADGVVITKADGDNLKASKLALAETRGALHLQSPQSSGWAPKAVTVSALENNGVVEIWKMILEYKSHVESGGYFEENRRLQKKQWLEESLENYFLELMNSDSIRTKKEKIMKEVLGDAMLPSDAARKLWDSVIRKD